MEGQLKILDVNDKTPVFNSPSGDVWIDEVGTLICLCQSKKCVIVFICKIIGIKTRIMVV